MIAIPLVNIGRGGEVVPRFVYIAGASQDFRVVASILDVIQPKRYGAVDLRCGRGMKR